MPSVCSVCPHEKRREIDKALILGKSVRGTARRYGITDDSLGRHRSCIASALEKADRVTAGRVLGYVENLVRKLQDMADEAHTQKQAAAFLMTARELRPTLELMGKLNGEIQAASVAAFMAQLGVQSESEVRDALRLTRSAQQPSLEECREELIALGRMVIAERPEWQAGIVAQLGGRLLSGASGGAALESHQTNGNGPSGDFVAGA
jgi:transposase-like protein